MKIRIFGLAVLAASALSSNAQKASIETASLSLRSYAKEGERLDVRMHNLKVANEQIDMAFANATTSNDPKMWLIRARTYLAMQTDTLGEGKKSCLPHADAIEIAAVSMVNCHKTDASKKFSRSAEAYTAFVHITANARYIGDLAYNNKEFEKAVRYYQHARSLVPFDDEALLKRQNITDEGLLYNIATAQKQAGMNDEAKKSYTQLIEKKYNDPWIYLELYEIQLEADKDTAMAIETINKGRAIFDEDANLRRQQIFIYSAAGRSNELVEIMDANIAADPYNGGSYFLRGLLLSEQGNLLKEEGDAAGAEALYKKAEADYIKAIENDDELLDAYEELGKYYYNKGAQISDEAAKLSIKETEKYDKMNAEVKLCFEKSIPNFEKIFALTSDPKQKNQAAQVLKAMYLKTEQMEKYNALKKDLENQ